MNSAFDDLISKWAGYFGVPFEWVKAVIATESSFYAKAYRAEPRINDGSYGLMQLLNRTAVSLGYSGDPAGLFDPDTNIKYGTKLLAQLQASYGDNFSKVYSAYNSGNANAYTTNPLVASNVSRAIGYLGQVIDEVKKKSKASPVAISGPRKPS